MKLKGIDVSKWQSRTIDFAKVKSSGIKFVMIRIGSGYGQKFCLDPMFVKHYNGAKKAGLKVGCYFYSYAYTPERAKAEAKEVLAVIKDYNFDYPICYDIEEKRQEKLGKTKISAMADAFLGEIEKAGYYAMLYSNKYWLSNFFTADILKKYDVWIAQYNNKVTWTGSYGIWQYSSTGHVNGVTGNVDMNIAYKDYATIIKNAGLNGFKKASTTVVASKPKTDSKPTTVAKSNTYTVKKGDTLSGIASKNNTTVANLVKLNRLKYPSLIFNKNLIKVGWVLKVK